ncbi:hypothetical protein [Metabacillus litoralis]|jgi:hypothetical protein|uniref:hypothetical protein n=1 Tax=Metabacillus litoralis TaxID=152268 RepID=UPI00203A670F|nr:hypothetical protein [Metabacillus litoralis]MCM3653405.1 hypothetical protein [Metabacillus litoralis]
MKTCAYCGSPVTFVDMDECYCSFCTMKLKREDVLENGKRKSLLPSSQPTLSDLNKSTPELMCFSTVELLFLLKLARKERADEFTEAAEYSFSEYEKATRKCFVLENLVRERIGYYPAKLTESYIQTLAARVEESSKKEMVIQQPKQIEN